jgi:hypothetical protein
MGVLLITCLINSVYLSVLLIAQKTSKTAFFIRLESKKGHRKYNDAQKTGKISHVIKVT